MVCMVRLGDVEAALQYGAEQQCDDTQLVQVRTTRVYLLNASVSLLRFAFSRLNSGRN